MDFNIESWCEITGDLKDGGSDLGGSMKKDLDSEENSYANKAFTCKTQNKMR